MRLFFNNSYFLIETRSLLPSQLFFPCRLSHSLHFFFLLTFSRALLTHPKLFRVLLFAFASICAKFRGREQLTSSLTYAHENDLKHSSSDRVFEFRAR